MPNVITIELSDTASDQAKRIGAIVHTAVAVGGTVTVERKRSA